LESLKSKKFKKAFQILITMHKRGFGLISSNQRFGIGHDEALDIAKEIEGVFVDERALTLYPQSIKADLEEKIFAIYTKNRYAMLSAKSLALKITWASEALILDIIGKDSDKKLVNFIKTLSIHNRFSLIPEIATLIQKELQKRANRYEGIVESMQERLWSDYVTHYYLTCIIGLRRFHQKSDIFTTFHHFGGRRQEKK
jgi:selenocysteine-specific elongation factor